MLNESLINQEVDSMMSEKGYDSRAKALLVAFFSSLSQKYNLSMDQFKEVIDRYKATVNNISFYNIGEASYSYTGDRELVFDKDTVENLNETNVEQLLQASIKGNTFALFGDYMQNCKNITEMSTLANLYSDVPELYSAVNDIIAGGFDIENGRAPALYADTFNNMVKSQDEGKRDEYEYYNTSRIVVLSVEDRLKELRKGQNVKEAFKGIYAASLLNMQIKTDIGLITEDTASNYVKMLDTFENYMRILNINPEELSSVAIDNKNWVVNPKSLIEKIEGKFAERGIEINRSSVNKTINTPMIDRKQMITIQNGIVDALDLKSKPLEIEEKVTRLIEEKKYPEEVRGILLEFFTRNADEFEWDSETSDKKIENLGKNVDRFEYVGKDVLGTASGKFNPSSHQIELLNKNNFTGNFEVATTLLHEIKHATDETNRGKVDLEHSFKTRIDQRDIEIAGLDELITEGSTIKIKGKNPYNDKYATTYKYDSGYAEFEGVLSMLSASLGMSESEFLKLANKGEDKCKDTLEKQYPGLNLSGRLDEIQDQLTKLNKVAFVRSYASKTYAEIFNTINSIYEDRVAVDSQKTDFDSMKARYEEYKINKNLVNTISFTRWSGKEFSRNIPNYSEVRKKARISPAEKEAFSEIGSQIIGQIKTRDNNTLVQSGKKVKSKTRNQISSKMVEWIKSKLSSKKALPEGTENPEIQNVDNLSNVWDLTTEELETFHRGEANFIQNSETMEKETPSQTERDNGEIDK